MKKLFAICAALVLLSACNANGGAPASAPPKAAVPTVIPTAPPATAAAPVTTAPAAEPLAADYVDVLDSWRLAIYENFGYKPTGQEVKSYPYIVNPDPSDFQQARYAFYDVDGNGVTELLIASFYDFGYFFIADIFTMRGGEPVRMFEGVEDRGFWARNRLDFSKDGTALIIEGSSGAAYSAYDFYRVTPDGHSVEFIEGLRTYNPDNIDDLTPHYRFAGGGYEVVSESDFDKVRAKYYDAATDAEPYYHSSFHKQIEWIPIAELKE